MALMALAGTALIAGPNNANDIVPGQCEVPADMLGSPYALKRTETRLRQGEPLNIVAIGSSSTAGAGASSVAHSIPASSRTSCSASSRARRSPSSIAASAARTSATC